MTVQTRRERERAERQQLIVRTARELAESEGWDAVTTRRLAELIEYSQPVLYSHFAGKDEIVAAVALEGFAEMAAALRRRRGLEPVLRAYFGFAEANPALYDAMFTMSTSLRFAVQETPQPLKDCFEAIRATLAPVSGTRDLDILTEVVWSALHGQILLTRGGRLPEHGKRKRLAMLVEQITA